MSDDTDLPSDINHEHTDGVICPWCGHNHKDSWEMDEGQHKCGSCSKPFWLGVTTRITYTTSKN